ncbi:nardilysin [Microplitis demolitor]|uniref:nardilysin n=1 Tax=Microplitis demolitor TaxID=69319 RepID=UPI0004CD8024|nr:nardilysin [Microplitis demolitor]
MVSLCSFKRLLECTVKKLNLSCSMPKRLYSYQESSRKKLKLNSSKFKRYKMVTPKNVKTLHSQSNSNLKQNDKTKTDECINENKNEDSNEIHESYVDVKVEYLDNPVKSSNDKKEYKVIKLPNGLTALLISDTHDLTDKVAGEQDAASTASSDEDDEEGSEEGSSDDEDDNEEEGEEMEMSDEDDKHAHLSKREEKMAACGLCVGVGSFSDPSEIPGMAHFLEHMVFMGSKKYPAENDFDSFIKKRGGSDNASTEPELTTFTFEIDEKYLYSALDRFAQFFIAPLMLRDAITREREAIESEFQMALPSDSNRKEQLFCSLAKPSHPATKFTWGNLVTLRDNITDDNLYKQLHKFRERHYSAHRMTLAIQARLPLDTLEDYVKKCFSVVPTNSLPSEDFSCHIGANSFDTASFRRIYKIKPVKDVCQIELTWTMPPLHHLYKEKPHQYISWIIGHEGKGSLISYLRKKMWCLDIYSGNGESGFEHSSMYALFSLSLVLTDQGHEHLKQVIDAIFSYINMVRKLGPQKRIFDEIRMIEDTNFRFTDEVPSIENVESLCENMHYYKSTDYITGSELYFEYNPESIRACMDVLTPDNVNIIIFDKKFDDSTFDKEEPWFKTKYTDTEIPADWIESWKNIDAMPEFHLPEPNIFITDDFTLIPAESIEAPVKIHQDTLCEIWYKPDAKFRLPECHMNFQLISPMIASSPEGTAMCDLMVEVLKQLLAEELYAAVAAELSYEVNSSEKGLLIKVYGFNQKLPLLLETIVKYISNFPEIVTEDLFKVMKEQQLKAYYNTFLKPSKLGKDVRLSIIMLKHWTAMDRHAACSKISFEEFKNFVKYFTKHIYIQSLIQGNTTSDEIKNNVLKCFDILKCGPLLPNTLPRLRTMSLPLGAHYCRFKNFNSTDSNSVVTNYYQSGLASIKLSVTIELLTMIMEEPLFNQLRTQEQLGYDVFCLLRDTYGVFGYSISVCTQADKFSVKHVDDRIEEFLKSFYEKLESLSDKDFENHKEGLIKIKQCADIHLREEVIRNWAEIKCGEYMFDRLTRETNEIRQITLKDLRNWFKDHIVGGNNFRKLSIHVVGTEKQRQESDKKLSDNEINKSEESAIKLSDASYALQYLHTDEDEDNRVFIKNIEKFKSGLYVYPERYSN